MLTRYPLRRGTAVPVLLEYVDAQGERSMRRVMPLAIVTDEAHQSSASSYIQARCSIANASRTFRMDRIESMSDAGTGETIEVVTWLATLELGKGRDFTWSDEPEEQPSPDASLAAVPTDFATPGRRIGWRAVMLALLIGYAIGRLRLIGIALRHYGMRHGIWL